MIENKKMIGSPAAWVFFFGTKVCLAPTDSPVEAMASIGYYTTTPTLSKIP